MTHPTDDEIMELAGAWFHTGENQKRDDGYYYRSLGTPSNVRGSDLIEFARALLAEQAKDAAEDAELLDWLEAMTDKGYCPAVVFDDDGHWAVLFDGIQSTPGDGPLTSSFIAGTETAWHDSIRAAIRAARAAERKA
jgi:hypothetical protein